MTDEKAPFNNAVNTLMKISDIIDKITKVSTEYILFSDIEGIRLSKNGVLKEFPDLENNEDWRKEAINRLKEHMNKMETEREKIDYVKKELEKFGYTALFFQRAGFRPEKFK